MTNGYEFGGFQFIPTETDWAQSEVVHTLDQAEVLGHTVYRLYHTILLTKHESWWVSSFEHQYQVHPAYGQIVGSGRRQERRRELVDEEQVFGLTKKQQARIGKTLAWIQQMDCELFPPDGDVDVSIPDFRNIQVFHAPVSHGSFYGLTEHGVYRVKESDEGRMVELYELTDERVGFVESLIPGRSSEYSPVREWLMVSDFAENYQPSN